MENEGTSNQTYNETTTNCKLLHTNRNKPHWARLPNDNTEYSDWQIDVNFIHYNHRQEIHDKGEKHEEKKEEHLKCNSNDDFHVETYSYLVHRYIIGPQSEYFNFLFSEKNSFCESFQKRSSFEFPSNEGINRQHFEDFLDILYDTTQGKEKLLRLDTNKGLGIFYFADYFGIEEVRKQAKQYLRSQLGFPTVCTVDEVAKIYTMAESLSVEELPDLVANRCLEIPILFHYIWSHLQSLDVQRDLMRRLCIERKGKSNKTKSWSVQIVNVCVRHPHIIDKDLFLELTRREMMPEIETVHSALQLMKQERRFGLDESEMDELTCLQQRCINKIYNRMNVKSRVTKYLTGQDIVMELRGLKSAVMESLLLRMMGCK